MVTVLVPHVGGPILPPGCPTVLIGGLPAARVTDMATCVGPPDVIAMGSPTVLIGNLMAARIGDPTAHGGVIVLGCPTVIIGEAGMGSARAPGLLMPGLNQELEEKKDRLRKRAALIAKARKTAPSLPQDKQKETLDVADRFERDTVAVERARLSSDVYPGKDGTRGTPPVGWDRLSDSPEKLEELGINPSDLTPSGSGFRATLYRSDIDGSLVVAYKGTTMTSMEDWKNNITQAVGVKSDYYERAIRLSQKLDANGEPFEITGHSLGGGMASAAAAVTGAKATTFNSAGLRNATVATYGATREGHDAQIQAYHVSGEILTSVQHLPLVPDAIGRQHTLPAVDDSGKSHLLDTFRMVEKHSMNRVINGMEKEKADDQHALESQVGSS
jgi:uncharacterized Zn-binding protein involved in type VI secretion